MKVRVSVEEAVNELFERGAIIDEAVSAMSARVASLGAEVDELRSAQTTVEVERPALTDQPATEPDWRELAVTMAGAWWRLNENRLVVIRCDGDSEEEQEAAHLWALADDACNKVRDANATTDTEGPL